LKVEKSGMDPTKGQGTERRIGGGSLFECKLGENGTVGPPDRRVASASLYCLLLIEDGHPGLWKLTGLNRCRSSITETYCDVTAKEGQQLVLLDWIFLLFSQY